MNDFTEGIQNFLSSQIGDHLKGIQFPVKKQQIVDLVKNNKAPDVVVNLLDKLPDREYGSMDDIKNAYEEIKKAF